MDLTAALAQPSTGDRPRADQAEGVLVGSRCGVCEAAGWPARAVCHRCGSADVRTVSFAPEGVLLTYTEVHVPRAGLEAPYTLGQVRIDDGGPIVFGHIRRLDPEAAVPVRVRLRLAPSPDDVPWYWFEPDPPSARSG
jgi:uncharacterized protein